MSKLKFGFKSPVVPSTKKVVEKYDFPAMIVHAPVVSEKKTSTKISFNTAAIALLNLTGTEQTAIFDLEGSVHLGIFKKPLENIPKSAILTIKASVGGEFYVRDMPTWKGLRQEFLPKDANADVVDVVLLVTAVDGHPDITTDFPDMVAYLLTLETLESPNESSETEVNVPVVDCKSVSMPPYLPGQISNHLASKPAESFDNDAEGLLDIVIHTGDHSMADTDPSPFGEEFTEPTKNDSTAQTQKVQQLFEEDMRPNIPSTPPAPPTPSVASGAIKDEWDD